MKKVSGLYSAPRPHWVGDGFPVRSMFSYHSQATQLSPFLLLDYAGPSEFAPTTQRRGVGQHPHRGFETVTIVYQGEVAHRDSTGNGGVIGPGDVQWMTAGSGILHEEFHSDVFARSGGTLEMVQIWVNLPATHKMTAPGYQAILNTDIPVVKLPDDAGMVRVIAGEFLEEKGPAQSFTPLQMWDLRINQGGICRLDVSEGWNTALVVLHGTVLVNDDTVAREAQLIVFDTPGRSLSIEANADAAILLLSGEPINEPMVGHGPFVMNTDAEIREAISDFQSGRFGEMR